MNVNLVIILILLFVFFYFYCKKLNLTFENNRYGEKEKFVSECWTYGDNYNACYSNSNCTIGFLPNGQTQCMKKFLQEDI